jgi:hypothetical protein
VGCEVDQHPHREIGIASKAHPFDLAVGG